MANDWISVCTNRKTGWNIQDAALTELTTLGGGGGWPISPCRWRTAAGRARGGQWFTP
jgi:hypothetical protein